MGVEVWEAGVMKSIKVTHKFDMHYAHNYDDTHFYCFVEVVLELNISAKV